MKKTVRTLAFLSLMLPFTLFATALNGPKIAWVSSETQDLGTLEMGKPVSTVFEFVNEGDAPLTILNVKTSCGCTASEWPKEAVAPGETASVKLTYSAASAGAFHKTAQVFTNAGENVAVLSVKGVVVQE